MTAKRPPWRPHQYTEEVGEKIVALLRSGAFLSDAAAMAEVNENTVLSWIKRGAKDPDCETGQFARAAKKARAEANEDTLNLLKVKEKGVWQAQAWLLERRSPFLFNTRARALVTSHVTGLLEIVRNQAPEKYDGIAAEYEKFEEDMR